MPDELIRMSRKLDNEDNQFLQLFLKEFENRRSAQEVEQELIKRIQKIERMLFGVSMFLVGLGVLEIRAILTFLKF